MFKESNIMGKGDGEVVLRGRRTNLGMTPA